MGRFTPAGTSTWLRTVLIASPSLIGACRLCIARRGKCVLNCVSLEIQCDKPLHGRIARRRGSAWVLLGQIVDADALQHAGNGFVHACQWLFDGAARGEVAPMGPFCARGNEQRPVDGVNHLESRYLPRVTRQCIPAIHTGMRAQQPRLGQPLQNLGQQLRRDAVRVGDVLGTLRRRLRVFGQIFQGHESVVRLFCQLEHEYPTGSVRVQYTTKCVRDSTRRASTPSWPDPMWKKVFEIFNENPFSFARETVTIGRKDARRPRDTWRPAGRGPDRLTSRDPSWGSTFLLPSVPAWTLFRYGHI